MWRWQTLDSMALAFYTSSRRKRIFIIIIEARNDADGEVVLMGQQKGHMGGLKKFLFVSYDGFIGDIAWILTKEGHQVKYFIESMDNRDIADGFVEKSDATFRDNPPRKG